MMPGLMLAPCAGMAAGVTLSRQLQGGRGRGWREHPSGWSCTGSNVLQADDTCVSSWDCLHTPRSHHCYSGIVDLVPSLPRTRSSSAPLLHLSEPRAVFPPS